MLVTDPAERADVATVMAHPWFRRGLDPRLAGLNDALLAGRGPRPSVVRSCSTTDEVRRVYATRCRLAQFSIASSQSASHPACLLDPGYLGTGGI